MQKIALTKGKFATVDDQDFDWLNQWKWCAKLCNRKWYAWRASRISEEGRPRRSIYMHQQIIPGAKEVDHHDGNGLNNRRNNLRPSNSQLNKWNTSRHRDGSSKFKGVRKRTDCNRWETRCGKESAGLFTEEVEAAKAYDRLALAKFGAFAKINFPCKSGNIKALNDGDLNPYGN